MIVYLSTVKCNKGEKPLKDVRKYVVLSFKQKYEVLCCIIQLLSLLKTLIYSSLDCDRITFKIRLVK